MHEDLLADLNSRVCDNDEVLQIARGNLTHFIYKTFDVGHLHGETEAHVPLTHIIRKQLLMEGYVRPHPLIPFSRWLSLEIIGPEDRGLVRWLFHLSLLHKKVMHEHSGWERPDIAAQLNELKPSAALRFAITRNLKDFPNYRGSASSTLPR